MQRLLDFVSGVLAAVTIASLLAAVPFALWRFGGLPGQDLIHVLQDPLASDQTRLNALLAATLAAVGWLCWAQLAYSLVLETVACIRGGTAAVATVLPGLQSLASRLVATSTLTIGSFAPTLPVAAEPLSLPQTIASVEVPTPSPSVDAVPGATASDAGPRGASYVTGERDTFWSIAEATLGEGRRWHEIRDLNVGKRMPDGTTIAGATEATRPGWALELPEDAVSPLAAPALEPRRSRSISVDEGDNFWDIAEEALIEDWGRAPTDAELAPYWRELVEANDDRLLPPEDPNLIYPGQQFELIPTPEDPTAPHATKPEATSPDEREFSTVEPPTPNTPTPTPTTATTAPPDPSIPSRALPATADRAEDHGVDWSGHYLTGLGSIGVGAGLTTLVLRRRRKNQLAKRPPAATHPQPTPDARQYEERIRPIADVDAARWIEAANQLLTARLRSQTERLPAVVAMRAGKFGVEILLDEPCAPPAGFVLANGAETAWRLHPDIELAQIEAEAADCQPYSPALVVIGSSGAGDLLLDLEQLAAISLEGDLTLMDGFLRSIAASLSTAPWSEHVAIVAIGLPEDVASLDRVAAPDDPDEWCANVTLAMSQLHEDAAGTPYEQRVTSGDVLHPTVVLLGSGFDEIANRLANTVQLMNAPLAIVAAGPLADAERIHLETEVSSLEPAGVAFKPIVTDVAEAGSARDLLQNAGTSAETLSGDDTQPTPDPGRNDEGWESAHDVIRRVDQPRPVEVKLLDATPSICGLESEPHGKLLSVLCYLAFHRQVPTQRLRDTFWPGGSRKTADNAISDLRTRLGADTSGAPVLGTATNDGTYQLSDDVGCDWTRVAHLVEEASRREPDEASVLLRAALEHVEGQAGRDAPTSTYAWLIDDYDTYSRIASTVTDGAHRLGELALAAGDTDLADWAAMKGLVAVPGNEAMYRLRMRVSAAGGDGNGVREAFQGAARCAAEMGPWVEVEPETEHLLNELTTSSELPAS